MWTRDVWHAHAPVNYRGTDTSFKGLGWLAVAEPQIERLLLATQPNHNTPRHSEGTHRRPLTFHRTGSRQLSPT